MDTVSRKKKIIMMGMMVMRIVMMRMMMARGKTAWLPCLPFSLLFFGVTIFSPPIARSETIWQVGDENYTRAEFISSDKKVIDYQVPADWESRLNQDQPDGASVWGEFPPFLYPGNDKANTTQEVRINFSYLQDYPQALLRVKASAYPSSTGQYLEVFMGETLIGKKLVEIPDYLFYDFPLSNIRQGFHEENIIIIKNVSNSENSLSYTLPIIFDAVRLENSGSDSDGDGISDFAEGDGDWDDDGVADKQDQDTSCIPLKSDDPAVIKKVWLDIKEPEERAFSFHEVRFLDPNSLNLPDWLRYGRCFPYGFFGFTISGCEPKEDVLLQIGINGSIDQFYPSLKVYTYCQTSNDWEEIDFQILAQSTVAISLKDGETGDLDGREDGSINTCLALSYPRSLGAKVEKRGCFIESAAVYKNFR